MKSEIQPPMSPEHELHLKAVLETFSKDLAAKYRRGQAEHGGALWLRPCWSDAMQEVVDLVAYVYTHRIQLGAIADLALAGCTDESVAASLARENCRKILHILQGMPSGFDKR